MMELSGALPAFVCDLNPNDVLMGRGAPSTEYSGNLKLRQLVLEHRDEYMNCTKRAGKNKISKRIIDTVHQRGGRFLHRVTTMEEARQLNVPPGKQAWRIVPPSPPLFIKVKQLMRDVGIVTQEKRRKRREEKKAAAAKMSSGDDQPVKSVIFPNQSSIAKMKRPPEQVRNESHQQLDVSQPHRNLKRSNSSIESNVGSSGSISASTEPGESQPASWHSLGGEDASTNPPGEQIQTDRMVRNAAGFHGAAAAATATATSSPREQPSLNLPARPTAAGPSDRPENPQSPLSPLVNAILWYHRQHQNLYDVLRAVIEVENHPRQDFPQAAGVSNELAKVLFQNLLFPERPSEQQEAMQDFTEMEHRLTQQDHEFLVLLQDILNRR